MDSQPTDDASARGAAGPLRTPGAPADEALPPELANHPDYAIVRKLGGGGIGLVFLAHNRLMGRHEVLKIIGPEIIEREGMRDRFLREIRAVARLRHPNIVTAYSAFRVGSSLILAMEYVEGLDLARMVNAKGPMPVGHACYFIHQAALGLQHAHEAGLVHRDINPGNLMLTRMGGRAIINMLSGKGGRAIIKVLDFGLAKAGREQEALDLAGSARMSRAPGTGHSLTAAGQMLGTPEFMAPEQIADAQRADIRADIYSLGCTLYYLLAARPPFQGETLHDVLQAHHSMEAMPLELARAEVPAELAALAAKMIAKDPGQRFQTPAEVATALAPFFKRQLVDRGGASLGDDSAEHREPSGFPTVATLAAASSVGAPAPPADAGARAWSSLIELRDTENDAAGPRPARERPRWSWPALGGAVGLAAVALGVVIVGLIKLTTMSATEHPRSAVKNTVEDTQAKLEPTVREPHADAPSNKNDDNGERRSAIAHVDAKASPGAAPPAPPNLENKGRTILKDPGLETARPVDRTNEPVDRARPQAPQTPKPAQDIREIAAFKPPDPVIQARLLADGQRVVYETSGQTRALWLGDVADPGRPRKLEGQAAPWTHLALSGDGRFAVLARPDRTLWRWSLDTGDSRRLRDRERADITALALSPDGSRAAYGCGGSIQFCDVKTGEKPTSNRKLREHPGSAIERIALCPDGRRVVTAHADATIRVWELENGRVTPGLQHRGAVTDVAVFPDGQSFVSSCADGTVGLWSLGTGQKLREFVVAVNGLFGEKDRSEVVAPGGVAAVSVSSDGRRALFGSGKLVVLWDLDTDEELRRIDHDADVLSVAFAFDGRHAVSSTRQTVRVWELPPGRPRGEPPPIVEVAHFIGTSNEQATDALISPDGKRVVAMYWDAVRIWDRHSGRLVQLLDHFGGPALAVSRDGRRALSAGGDKIIRRWDLDSGHLVQEFRGHSEFIFSVAFSRDGRLAYSSSGGTNPWTDGKDSAIRVWDLVAKSEPGGLKGHQGIVRSLAVSLDGRFLLSGGSDKSPILWDAQSGRERRRLHGHTGAVECVAFLPDGRHAVSSGQDQTIRLWDVDTGNELHRFDGHKSAVNWVAVSPDGRRLLSSSYWGRELRLWDVEAKKQIARIGFGGVPPNRGRFTPEGNFAVWGGSDGVVRMYRLNDPDPAVRLMEPAEPDPPASAASGAR